MNYIKDLNNFYDKIQSDSDIAPCQIALYLALFQCWNKNRFKNPILITRDEMMRLSKVASKSTYHRSMAILHDNGYITYMPSHNPYIGSKVHLNDLSKPLKKVKTTSPKKNKAIDKAMSKPMGQAVPNQVQPINTAMSTPTDTPIGQAVPNQVQPISTPMSTPMSTPIEPIYKHINNKHTNNKLSQKKEREIFQNEEIIFQKNEEKKIKSNLEIEKKSNLKNKKKEVVVEEKIPQKEKSFAKKEKDEIPTLEEVKLFFEEKNASLLEAEKFFNYFESNGWLVGGKTKMKKWKAAASNWVINANMPKLNVFGGQKPLDTSSNKRYDEPL